MLWQINANVSSSSNSAKQKGGNKSDHEIPASKYINAPNGQVMLFEDDLILFHSKENFSSLALHEEHIDEKGKTLGITMRTKGDINFVGENINIGVIEDVSKTVKINSDQGIDLVCAMSSLIVDATDGAHFKAPKVKLYPEIEFEEVIGMIIMAENVDEGTGNLWSNTIAAIIKMGTEEFWGYFHNQVQDHIESKYPTLKTELTVYFGKKKYGRIDVYDPSTMEIYEVKPFYSLKKGKKQLKKYISRFDENHNKKGMKKPRIGKQNIEGEFKSKEGAFNISYATYGASGVIGYAVTPNSSKEKELRSQGAPSKAFQQLKELYKKFDKEYQKDLPWQLRDKGEPWSILMPEFPKLPSFANLPSVGDQNKLDKWSKKIMLFTNALWDQIKGKK